MWRETFLKIYLNWCGIIAAPCVVSTGLKGGKGNWKIKCSLKIWLTNVQAERQRFQKKHILPLPSSGNIVTYGLIQPTRQDSVSQPQVTLCKDLGNQINVQNYFKFSSVIHQLYTLITNKIDSCKFKSVHLKLVVVTHKKHFTLLIFPSNLRLTPK